MSENHSKRKVAAESLESKTLACVCCKKSFENVESLETHSGSCWTVNSSPSGSPSLRKTDSVRQSLSPDSKQFFKKDEHEEKSFEENPTKGNTKGDLEKSKNTAKCECEFCGRSFDTQRGLNQHQRTNKHCQRLQKKMKQDQTPTQFQNSKHKTKDQKVPSFESLNLEISSRKVPKSDIFICESCGGAWGNEIALLKHSEVCPVLSEKDQKDVRQIPISKVETNFETNFDSKQFHNRSLPRVHKKIEQVFIGGIPECSDLEKVKKLLKDIDAHCKLELFFKKPSRPYCGKIYTQFPARFLQNEIVIESLKVRTAPFKEKSSKHKPDKQNLRNQSKHQFSTTRHFLKPSKKIHQWIKKDDTKDSKMIQKIEKMEKQIQNMNATIEIQTKENTLLRTEIVGLRQQLEKLLDIVLPQQNLPESPKIERKNQKNVERLQISPQKNKFVGNRMSSSQPLKFPTTKKRAMTLLTPIITPKPLQIRKFQKNYTGQKIQKLQHTDQKDALFIHAIPFNGVISRESSSESNNNNDL